VGAGLIGFLVVLALVVAAVFLFRSMSRHLRKVPQSFETKSFEAESFETQSPDPPPEPSGDKPSG
jgi:hypothetical protein